MVAGFLFCAVGMTAAAVVEWKGCDNPVSAALSGVIAGLCVVVAIVTLMGL
jgi:hypothetical protein